MTKLKLSDWASIAEVIGAVAVVISLIYVGYQIRANTIEVRAINRQEFVSRSLVATHTAASSPTLAGALVKSAEGATLSAEELAQYQYFVRGMQYDIQEAFLLYMEGRLDEAYWQTRAAIFKAYMESPYGREVYREHRSLGVLHPTFTDWADQVVEND